MVNMLFAAVIGSILISFGAGAFICEDATLTVSKVIDGDTIKVTSPVFDTMSILENEKSIRFAIISAPELREEGGEEARQKLIELCPVGSIITFEDDPAQRESFGRAVGLVYCNGNEKSLNQLMLESGLVKYSHKHKTGFTYDWIDQFKNK